MDIVDNINLKPFTLDSGIEIPRYLMIPMNYTARVTLPLSYLPLRGNIYESLNEEQRTMLDIINKYHEEYSYLSPYIYNVLETLNLANQFGVILIWGKLRDELMENIIMSSIKTIQSRTQFSEEDTKAFLSGIENFCNTIINDIGPSPYEPSKDVPYEVKFFQMPTPKHELRPTSLQIVGYNRHPMYRQNLTPYDISNLVQMSEANKYVKGKETIFILAHGEMVNELSPDLKMLANKYLRVIELGKKHNLLATKYPSIYLLINKILLNPDNAVMFENTDAGDEKRKQIFDEICKYLVINSVDACSMKDILSLTEITHDRKFSGHFKDIDVEEYHDVTMNTLYHFYSMGIFKPVGYIKKDRIPLIKKKIFELYPGTTFSTENTTFELVKTLLPIAVRQNKVMNILIFSCAVEFRNTDPYIENPNPLYKKPSEVTPAMKLLIQGKKFIYCVNKMIAFFIHAFEKDIISRYDIIIIGKKYSYNKKFDYFPPGEPPKNVEITQLETNLDKFFSRYFTIFLQEIGSFNYNAVFSFAGIDGENISYDLIEDGNPIANTPYINEIIKVKIYLMQELYETFNNVIDYCLAILRDLLDAFTKYYDINLGGDVAMLSNISTDIDIVNSINKFFTSLNQTITYIKSGFYGSSSAISPYPIPPQFLRYTKYIEVKKEYDESHVKDLYDEINEGMDYYRFRRDIPDINGMTMEQYFPVPLKGLIANSKPPGQFHHIARSTYKYKEIPNVDKAKRRVKTFKANKANKLKNGSFIENAIGSYHISV